MSKTKEMAAVIADLRKVAASITETADWLEQQFAGSMDSEEPPAESHESPANPTLTLEQVRAVLADKSRDGHTAEIRQLILKYGADRLSQVAPEHYKALLRDVEGL